MMMISVRKLLFYHEIKTLGLVLTVGTDWNQISDAGSQEKPNASAGKVKDSSKA